MTIGEILIWEATNVLLLIPVVIALVILTRWIRGRPLFTERDWLFLFGQTWERVFSVHFWIRFGALWLTLVLIGFVEGYVYVPHRSRSVPWLRFSHRVCSLAFCAEVVTLMEWANPPVAISHR